MWVLLRAVPLKYPFRRQAYNHLELNVGLDVLICLSSWGLGLRFLGFWASLGFASSGFRLPVVSSHRPCFWGNPLILAVSCSLNPKP